MASRLGALWQSLKPPPVPPDGNMALADHLRELRYRLVASVIAIVVGMIVVSFFFDHLFQILMHPIDLAVADLKQTRPDQQINVVTNGVATPMTLWLKVVGIAGLIVTSPLWLWQLWAFIAPGLLAKEKKWAVIFIGSAVPLFLAGVTVGYLVMPKGISVMLSFTPASQGINNLLDLPYFLSFLIRMMLVFGGAFLLPVVLVVLNLAGILRGRQLAAARSYAIFGVFVFAAVATPSTDPLSMLVLAIPMAVLYEIAEVICRLHDKARKVDELEVIV